MINAQPNGKINQPKGTVKDKNVNIVDYGLCLVGDSLSRTFTLENTGTEVLRLGGFDPSYYKGSDPNYPGHIEDYSEFDPPIDSQPPFSIGVGQKHELRMTYFARDTSKKPGKKFVLLKLGLYDSRIPDQPSPGYDDMVALDSFLLIARKTEHYIDGYESEYDFDSVYVNPPAKVPWIWQVKNVSKADLEIESDTIIPLSPNPGFRINKILNQPIYQKNVIPIEIEYYPTDIGGDSAKYRLKYKPHPILYPDSIDYAIVTLNGVGVKQNLDIVDPTDVKFYGDTLDFGEVWVETKRKATAFLKNTGNLRFGAVSQKIENKFGESDTLFRLLDGIKELPFNLDTNKTDSFQIEFQPKERGNFIAKFVIMDDIASRNIKGIPAEALNDTIYLKGTGIEPEISVASDIIDFGNVVWCLDFQTSGTFSLQLNNLGNTTLHIQDPIIDPPFTVPIPIDTIAAYSQRTMQVVFNANELGNYSDTLFIISKDVRPPKDTLKLIVKASSVKPQATRLLIPNDIKAKPGRLISVPIIVDEKNINTARIFTDTLTYDASLLRFNGYENINTASEAADRIEIIPNFNSSRLSVIIEKHGKNYFLPNDTLILLKFKTYLGDKVSTPISFADPEFGDGFCSQVLTPNITNGKFTLDSICGLNLKAIPHTTKIFRFEDIYPNPANEKIQFEYEMAFTTNIKISIYNSYGELVEKPIDNTLPAGTYQLSYPTNNMTPGIYYFEMQAGLFRQIKKVVLTK
ncbi:MAG: T9SS type A sorting domain-containing protein [Bacteroidetes bacterium]|nr:T9SS type A sorting domain-containing protein [Bacteroidota bacterium]